MKSVIERPKEIKAAVSRFRERVGELSGLPQIMEWGFPDGERFDYPTYTLKTYRGPLQIGVPKYWRNRAPHLFRFENDEGPPSPDVEVNIPNELNRGISGVYVKGEKSIWLCSRGHFTAYRGRIRREIVFRHFNKWLVEVQDGDRRSHVIPVGALDSLTLANDLADFVHAVMIFKEFYKEGVDTESLPEIKWSSGEEFEGTKKTKGRTESTDYEYLHGPLCNQLKSALSDIVAGNTEYCVRKNQHIDAAIVRLNNGKAEYIFEVKTSENMGGQIYSAIGQLFFYRHMYGTNTSSLALVLPAVCRKTAGEVERFVNALGIMLVYGESGVFELSDGKSLASVVKRAIAL